MSSRILLAIVAITTTCIPHVRSFTGNATNRNISVNSQSSSPYYKQGQGRLSLLVPQYAHQSDSNEKKADEDDAPSDIEIELESLQNQITSIEALEERNKAQLGSFVDEQDQWDYLEDFERELLSSKDETVKRMEKIAEELLQLWMGAKSMEG